MPLEQGKTPVEGSETLTSEQIYLETILLGFRQEMGGSRDLSGREGTEEVLRHLQLAGVVEVVEGRSCPRSKDSSWPTASPPVFRLNPVHTDIISFILVIFVPCRPSPAISPS